MLSSVRSKSFAGDRFESCFITFAVTPTCTKMGTLKHPQKPGKNWLWMAWDGPWNIIETPGNPQMKPLGCPVGGRYAQCGSRPIGSETRRRSRCQSLFGHSSTTWGAAQLSAQLSCGSKVDLTRSNRSNPVVNHAILWLYDVIWCHLMLFVIWYSYMAHNSPL